MTIPPAVEETQTSTTEEPAPVDPARALPKRAWWHRHLEPEERRRVMADLAITRQEHWAYRFTVMLTLSVVVAVMGLSADSAAVVIGAMLLAPLMTPVLATAGCLSMALFRKAAAAALKVALATAWVILLSYLLAKAFVPDVPLPDEVISRTKPDIRDLVVALAAGAAGSYATVRRDASAALPGVAVAVALVPPLATVGIAMEADNRAYAEGALLLYTTNLAAIIFASVVVFVVTGFVPPRRLATKRLRLATTTLIVIAVVMAIAVPLYRASQGAVAATNRQTEADEIVDAWLGPVAEDRSVDLSRLDEGRILIEVRSFESPIDGESVSRNLQAEFGEDVAVSIRWDRVERASTTTTASPTTTTPSDADLLLAQVEKIVDGWLSDNGDGLDYEREEIVINDGRLRIDATGTGDPPDIADLERRLDEELDQVLETRLNWTPRQTLTPGTTTPSPIEELQQRMSRTVDQWAAEQETTVELFLYDGERARLEVIGLSEPDTNGLVVELHEIAGEEFPIDVLFTLRQLITTTTLPPITVFEDDSATTTTTG